MPMGRYLFFGIDGASLRGRDDEVEGKIMGEKVL